MRRRQPLGTGLAAFSLATQKKPFFLFLFSLSQAPRDTVSTLISWYKMPTSGRAWMRPEAGASVYISRRPHGRESRPPETPRDPIATKEGRGGGKRKKRGYLVDPRSP